MCGVVVRTLAGVPPPMCLTLNPRSGFLLVQTLGSSNGSSSIPTPTKPRLHPHPHFYLPQPLWASGERQMTELVRSFSGSLKEMEP